MFLYNVCILLFFRGMLCQPQILSNIKIPQSVNITPVIQDESNEIISKLKKLPNITFTCYNPKPVFKVLEPSISINKNGRDGLVKRQNNNIINTNQILNINVKKRKSYTNLKETPVHYPEKENYQFVNNYNKEVFYKYPNSKKPKKIFNTNPVDSIPASQTIDITDDDTDLGYNNFVKGFSQSVNSNAHLKTSQNNKMGHNISESTSNVLNEIPLLQEMNIFCDNLIKMNSEVFKSPKPIKKNLNRPLNTSNNSNTDSGKCPRKCKKITHSTNVKKTKKSNMISKNKLTNLKAETSISKVEKSAICEDYTLMDISSMGQVNIIPSLPPENLFDSTDPGCHSLTTDFDQLGNNLGNMHMAKDSYNVLNGEGILQIMTRFFCDNLV